MGDEDLRPRLCTIRKWQDFPGFGFNLHAERGRAGQYIGKVDDDSPAEAAGMKEGDRIVEVNGTNIGNENHSQVVTRIKAAGETVSMLLVDAATDKHYKDQKVIVSNELPEVSRMETPPRPGADDEEETTTSEGDVKTALNVATVEPAVFKVEEQKESIFVENGSNTIVEEITDESAAADDKPSESVEEPNDKSKHEIDEDMLKEVAITLHGGSGAEQGTVEGTSDTDGDETEMGETNAISATENIEVNGNDDVELPPPVPDSELPADDPPSYTDAEQEEIQREPTPEPEPERESSPEPEREPSPEPELEREPSPEPEPERYPTPEPVPIIAETPQHNYHPRLCLIRKWADFQGYGFNLHAEQNKKGQYIGLVDANSPAENADLRKGDRIIEVNGKNIEDESHQQVIQMIKAGGDETKMLVVDSEADEYYKNNGIRITADMSEVIANETTPREVPTSTFSPRQCHVIKWPDFAGYGFNLHAEKERGGQYIGTIDHNSPAESAGLREHDRIIEVNGDNIENETHQQVIAKIKAGGNETKMLVVDHEADAYYKSRGITVTASMAEIQFLQTTQHAAVTNGDSIPAQQPYRPAPEPYRPATQPTRVEPVIQNTEPAQANGGDFMSMNLSAKEMRERLAQKKRRDPKHKSNMDFKSKFEIFQKM